MNVTLPDRFLSNDAPKAKTAGVEQRLATLGRESISRREPPEPSTGTEWNHVRELGEANLKMVRTSEAKIEKMDVGSDSDDDSASDDDGSGSYDGSDSDGGIGNDDDSVNSDGSNNSDTAAMLDLDWDTSTWSLNEIESACSTLLTECETAASAKRRGLSMKMLLRLMDRHKSAVRYVEVALETVTNRGLPSLTYGIDARVFNMAHVIAAFAPRLPEKMSQMNCIPRIVNIINLEATLAARLIQHRRRVQMARRVQRELAARGGDGHNALPRDIVVRRRLTSNMKTDKLNQQWRAMHGPPLEDGTPPAGALASDVLVSYLKALLAFCQPENEKMYKSCRGQVVDAGGLLPIAAGLRAGGEVHEVAALLALELAQEKELVLPLLNAELAGATAGIIRPGAPYAARYRALDILDMLAMSAYRWADVNRTPGAGPASAFPAEDGADAEPGGGALEARGAYGGGAPVLAAIRSKLVTRRCTAPILECLRSEDGQLFLGAVMVLHKMTCSIGYHTVLDEVLATAGVAMDRLVEGLRSEHAYVPLACLAVLGQLATRHEGRAGMVTTKVVTMLSTLCAGTETSSGARVFVLALVALVRLAQRGSQASIPPNTPLDITRVDITEVLYDNLMSVLSEDKGADTNASIEQLHTLNILPFVVRFLVRPEHKSHYFDLSKHHQYMGVLSLYRLSARTLVRPTLFCDGVLRYLCYAAQNSWLEITDGTLSELPHGDVPVFFLSVQAACRALACLARARSPPDAQARVFDMLLETRAMTEVASMLAYPVLERLDPLLSVKLECIDAAAHLVTAVCPTPSLERAPCVRQETRDTEAESSASAQPVVERLLKSCLKPMLDILSMSDNRRVLSSTCSALTKLSAIPSGAATLLEQNIVRLLSRHFPNSPVKPLALAGDPDAPPDRSAAKLLTLPTSLVALLASLARLREGRSAMHSAGMYRRVLELFCLISDARGGPSKKAAGGGAVLRAEVCHFLARMANVSHAAIGSTNDLALAPQYGVLAKLVAAANARGSMQCRYFATWALAALAEDTLRIIPRLVKADAVPALVAVVVEHQVSPQPLLRHALVALQRIAAYPGGTFVPDLVKCGASAPLMHIGADVQLELSNGGVGDRESLGDVARDTLGLVSEARGGGGTDAAAATPAAGGTAATEGGPDDATPYSYSDDDGDSDDGGRARSDAYSSDADATAALVPTLGVRGFDGSYASMGVTSHGGLGLTAGWDEEPGGLASTMGATTTTTPLAQLSARSKGFRAELRRRKEYYGLSRTPGRSAEEAAGAPPSPLAFTTRSQSTPSLARFDVSANPELMSTRPRPRPRQRQAASQRLPKLGAASARRSQELVSFARTGPARQSPGDALVLDPVFGGDAQPARTKLPLRLTIKPPPVLAPGKGGAVSGTFENIHELVSQARVRALEERGAV